MSTPAVGPLPNHPDAITPAWLTECLRSSGALPRGAVKDVSIDLRRNWNMAQSGHANLTYDSDAPVDAPKAVFVKITAVEDPYAELVGGEFEFYIENSSSNLPVPRVYGAFCNEDTGIRCLILEDLSETHWQTPWPIPPTLSMCESAVSSLARLHAHEWCTDVHDSALAEELITRAEKFGGHLANLLPKFIDYLGERLTSERRKIFAHVCESLPELMASRNTGGSPITRVHGDAHCWNMLFPNDPSKHDCVLLDLEDRYHAPGAFDLAYMMALHWSPDRRAHHEKHLLQHYTEQLNEQTPQSTRWAELMYDYRLGHLHNFVVPLFQLDMGTEPVVWWEHTERLFLSYDDLHCAELLG